MKVILLFGFLFAFSCTGKFSAESSLQKIDAGNSSQSATGSAQLQLNWNSNAVEQQGFYIESSNDGFNFTQVMQVPDGTNSVKVPATPGQKYYFRIRAYNQAGDSAYSAIVLGSL